MSIIHIHAWTTEYRSVPAALDGEIKTNSFLTLRCIVLQPTV